MSSQTCCNAKGCTTRKCLEQIFLCSNHIDILNFDQKEAISIKSERDQLKNDKTALEALVKTTASERDQLLKDKTALEDKVAKLEATVHKISSVSSTKSSGGTTITFSMDDL